MTDRNESASLQPAAPATRATQARTTAEYRALDAAPVSYTHLTLPTM